MYPQFPISNSLLPGYTFNQLSYSLVKVEYTFPTSVTENEILFNYNRDNNSIFLGIKEQPNPVICGILSYPVNNVSTTFENSLYTINLETDPNEQNSWSLLIKEPSKTGIDAKSEFLLGSDANSKKNYEEAFKLIESSAEKQYLPAMEALADIYCAQDSPYHDHYNLENAVQILSTLFELTDTPESGIRLAEAYQSLDQPEKAKEVLQKCYEKSNEAKLMLAMLLSPITGKLSQPEPERAVQLFRELANDRVSDAVSALILHIEKGVGTPVDQKEIDRLRAEFKSIQRENFRNKIKSSKSKYVFIGLSAAAAVCVAVAGFAFLKRRRH